jgi:hypothetical protein
MPLKVTFHRLTDHFTIISSTVLELVAMESKVSTDVE